MPTLPTNRTTANTAAEHVDDHNTLHALNNAFVSGYFPDMAPASPHANDDEFNDASLGAAWTEWDHGTVVTVSEGDHGLKLVNANTTGNKLGGVRRNIPAGDFTVVTAVAIFAKKQSFSTAGIVVLEDAASATGDAVTFGQDPTNAGFQVVQHFSAYNAVAGNAHISAAPEVFARYLRLRRIGAAYHYDTSPDGRMWQHHYIYNPLPFTPQHIGVFVDTNNAAVTTGAWFRFWRQSTDTAFDVPLLGRIL